LFALLIGSVKALPQDDGGLTPSGTDSMAPIPSSSDSESL
jgi:hypothetical protein